MKRTFAPAIALGFALTFAAPAWADDGVKAEVVERDAKGHATKVKVGETIYAVCTPESQDGCINPREAGLNFGSTPLDHWPGEPASGLTAAEKMRTAEQNEAARAKLEAAAQPAEQQSAE